MNREPAWVGLCLLSGAVICGADGVDSRHSGYHVPQSDCLRWRAEPAPSRHLRRTA